MGDCILSGENSAQLRWSDLVNLPPDILLLIIEQLHDEGNPQYLTPLALSCSKLCSLTQPYIYSHQLINITVVTQPTLHFALTRRVVLLHRTLADHPELRRYVRNVRIKFGKRLPNGLGKRVRTMSREELKALESNFESSTYWPALLDLMSWFINLRSLDIRWLTVPRSPLENNERKLYSFLSNLELLEALQIGGNFKIFPTDILTLLHPKSHLKELSIISFLDVELHNKPSASLESSMLDQTLAHLKYLDISDNDPSLWKDAFSSCKNLRILHWGTINSSQPLLQPGTCLQDALTVLPSLREIHLSFLGECFPFLTDLKISGLPSIQKLSLYQWMISPQNTADEVYQTLLQNNVEAVEWQYHEWEGQEIQMTAALLSTIRKALMIHSSKLKHLELKLTIGIKGPLDQERHRQLEEEMSRFEKDCASNHIECRFTIRADDEDLSDEY